MGLFLNGIQEVGGSIPPGSTNQSFHLWIPAQKLRPELVPGMEVEEMLLARNDVAVPDFELDTAHHIQGLAVPPAGAAMDAHHVSGVIGNDVHQFRPEGAMRFAAIAAELSEDVGA